MIILCAQFAFHLHMNLWYAKLVKHVLIAMSAFYLGKDKIMEIINVLPVIKK